MRILVLATLALCAAPGCGSSPPALRAGESRPLTPAPPFTADPLRPEHILIHPLTHAATSPDGRASIVVHAELRDRFNQNTRALGRLRLTILPPGPSLSIDDRAPAQPPDSTWLIDLADPERNASLFDDLVTRTYVLHLTDLPRWLADWIASSDTDAPILTAEFEFADLDGAPHALSTTARLAR